MFNKFVKDNIAKYDTALENHDERIKRCNLLLAEKDEQVQNIFDKFQMQETELVAQADFDVLLDRFNLFSEIENIDVL